jgi:hypothetical protein
MSTEYETAVVSGQLLFHTVYKINLWEEKFETFVTAEINNRTE